MALSDSHRANFETIRRAFVRDVCLLEVTDKATGEPRAAVCAGVWSGDEYLLTPFALMIDGDPFETLTPPEGG